MSKNSDLLDRERHEAFERLLHIHKLMFRENDSLPRGQAVLNCIAFWRDKPGAEDILAMLTACIIYISICPGIAIC